MKLYFIPTTRAVRPRWLLEEMAVPYELIYVNMEMTKREDYRQLHPHGKVPVLVDKEITIFESAAICSYLADKYIDKGFAPKLEDSSRAYYYQWLFYATLTLEPPGEQFMFNILPNLPEKLIPISQRTHLSCEQSQEWFERVCEPLNNILQDNHYLVNNSFSAADIVTGGVLVWALKLGMMTHNSPVKDYVTRLMERPAFKKSDEHFVTTK